MALSNLDRALDEAFTHEGPKGWRFGTDFNDASWFTLFPDITETGNAAAPAADDINVEELNGILLITTGTTDNDDLSFFTDAETIILQANKNYWFSCRVNSVVETTDIGYIFGLGNYDTPSDLLGTPPTEGVYFQTKGDGTDIDLVWNKATTQIEQAGLGTVGADTFVKLGWKIEMSTAAGTGTVTAYVDDVIAYGPTEVSTLPLLSMGPMMYVEAEATGAKVVEVDFFFCGGDR